ncbi:MAG: type VI secretion system baseplate subunit TssK, partial [Burkholderiales bacterium]|nr:type VI secretion system baseplate subunit TssK [Burkholderiales bacterium]
MSWNDKVIWSEGMFLQPQHFQQHDRYLERLIESRTAPIAAHHWGFMNLLIDEAALALGKIALTSARGIMPDGTPFDFPNTDPAPPPLDIPREAKNQAIVLALPMRRYGSDGADDDGGLARHSLSDFEVQDSGAAERGALLQVGRLRLRVLLQNDATAAYANLGIARVIERRADNQLVLDRGYIPPTLSIRNNGILSGYAAELRGLLHQRGDALGGRLSQPGRGGVAEIADFLLLQTVNRFEPLFSHFAQSPLLHPQQLYATCLSLAGDLSTFSRENRRPLAYPDYVHDDLENSFAPLMADLRRSLSMVPEQRVIPIELKDRSYGVRVAIIPDLDLLKSASFVLAVNAQVPPEALRNRFPTQVKIGPVERIRDLVNLHLPGIPLHSLPVAPRQIPYHAGFNYFE